MSVRSRRVLLALVVVCAVGPQGSVGAAVICPPSPFQRASKPLVISHASSAALGPPNTIELMRAGIAAGADIIDADLQLTSDGVLVAAHDDDLAATTNGTGSIRHTTLANVQKLDDAWKWPGPKKDFPLRGKGVRMPTVQQMLTAFPHQRISLEFKTGGGEQSLCDLLRRTKRTKDIYVSSDGAWVENFGRDCPEVTTTLTDAEVAPLIAARNDPASTWCSPAPIGQPSFARAGKRMTKESVDWNHRHGMAVYTWTVDDPELLTLAKQIGVDAVYTGRPDLARAIFDAKT